MKLSIVLVNFRGWKRLRPCLESLNCLKKSSFSWEVIVVDNQSDDGHLPVFMKDFPTYQFIENSGNFGFANGCNLGARYSSGEYIFFLNPDTIVNLEAISRLIKSMEENPDVTILSCRQTDENGKDTHPYGLFLRPATLTGVFRAVFRLLKKPRENILLRSGEKAILPEWVSGSAIMISRKKFDQLRGWSEDYWMYYEDADLCKRVTDSGDKIALLSDTQIIHNHGGSSRVNVEIKALTKCEVSISRHVYIHKHFSQITGALMQSYLVINNLLLGHLILAVLGLFLFFIPGMRSYPKLYMNIISYYASALKNKTWLSPRSVNFNKTKKHPQ